MKPYQFLALVSLMIALHGAPYSMEKDSIQFEIVLLMVAFVACVIGYETYRIIKSLR